MRGVHVLTNVAMGFINDSQMKYNDQELKTVRNAFQQFISKRINREQAKQIIFPIIKSEEPFNRICAILETEFQPAIPKPTEKTSNLSRKKTRAWTINEDNRLYMGVCIYGPDNWNEIAPFVGNGRLRSQCSQRWIRVLDPMISKTAWTYEEDSMLLYYVNIFGEKSWMRVANQIGSRSDVQCRYRFHQLQKEITNCQSNNFANQNDIISEDQQSQQLSFPSPQESISLNEQMHPFTNSLGIFQSNSLFDSTIWLKEKFLF